MKTSLKRLLLGAAILTLATAALCITQFSFFIIPPGGLLPDGKLLLTSKLENIGFIDSPKAMCKRDNPTALDEWCQIGAIGFIVDNSKIYARMPHFRPLKFLTPE